MSKPVRFDPRAESEVLDAVAYYAERDDRLPPRLLAELDEVVAQIASSPKAFSYAEVRPARRIHLTSFPYRVVYVELKRRIQVVALAHVSQRPGYWQRRLKDASD